MADLVPVRRDEQLPAFAPAEVDSARRYRDASRADGTRTKYGADWAAFGRWCQERGHPALPAHPGAVAVYLSALADRHLAPSTVGRILAALGHHHRLAGLVAPHRAEGGTTILDILAGIRRSHRTPPARKAVADSYVPHAVLRAIDGDSLADVRDRALLAFAWPRPCAVRNWWRSRLPTWNGCRTACGFAWCAARPTRRAGAW